MAPATMIEFDTYDDTAAAPAATDCDPLGPLVNHRFALPSASGENLASFTASYTFKSYAQRPPAS